MVDSSGLKGEKISDEIADAKVLWKRLATTEVTSRLTHLEL